MRALQARFHAGELPRLGAASHSPHRCSGRVCKKSRRMCKSGLEVDREIWPLRPTPGQSGNTTVWPARACFERRPVDQSSLYKIDHFPNLKSGMVS
jgi:hypothetical protein